MPIDPSERDDTASDTAIDLIWQAAEDAVIHTVHMAQAENPYPAGSWQADIWRHAFRAAYAREWGY